MTPRLALEDFAAVSDPCICGGGPGVGCVAGCPSLDDAPCCEGSAPSAGDDVERTPRPSADQVPCRCGNPACPQGRP